MESSDVPQRYQDLNVQSNIKIVNVTDADGNPTGGTVNMRMRDRNPLRIQWQDGPRETNADGNLQASNGAFVEDVIYAAIQRLQFFQNSKYETNDNANAIGHLEQALKCLDNRRQDRANRGVEGKHEI